MSTEVGISAVETVAPSWKSTRVPVGRARVKVYSSARFPMPRGSAKLSARTRTVTSPGRTVPLKA